MNEVLATIDATANKRLKEGFSQFNFTAGVLNCMLVAYVFGAFPQHFWLLYIVEALILIPMKLYLNWNAKPLNEILYHLDYCWVMNIVGTFTLIALSFWESLQSDNRIASSSSASTEVRKQLYMTVMGVACGPLLGATLLLPFVAVVFHDVIAMTNLFIHIYPPMLMYTFRWNTDLIREAWPHIFGLDYLDEVHFFPSRNNAASGSNWWILIPGNGLGSIAGNANALYLIWFIPYVLWMLVFGMNLPRKNRRQKDGSLIVPRWDTVFHATVRHGLYITFGNIFWARPRVISQAHMLQDDYEVRDFLVYMAIHSSLSYLGTMTLAYACFHYKYIHAALLVVLTITCVHRGSQRYTYYVTSMYGRAVRAVIGKNKKND
jgi:hypothetical protein